VDEEEAEYEHLVEGENRDSIPSDLSSIRPSEDSRCSSSSLRPSVDSINGINTGFF